MTRNTCSKNLYAKVSETLIGGNIGRGCEYLSDFVFDFKEALTFFKFKKFD